MAMSRGSSHDRGVERETGTKELGAGALWRTRRSVVDKMADCKALFGRGKWVGELGPDVEKAKYGEHLQ